MLFFFKSDSKTDSLLSKNSKLFFFFFDYFNFDVSLSLK